MHRSAFVSPALRVLAATQHDLVTTAQARQLGYSADDLEGMVARHALDRVAFGVLRLSSSEPPPALGSAAALTVAVLGVGRPIAVSHGSAARWWGCEDLGEGWSDLTVPPGREVRRWCEATLHRRELPPGSVAERRGLPVTTPVRTIADLALQAWHRTLLVRFVDHLLRARHVGVRDLLIGVERLAGHPGQAAARVLLDGHLEGARLSDTATVDREGWVRRVAAGAGLPALVPQFGVELAGRLVWVDLAIPAAKVAVEFDSWEWHAGRGRFDADRRRWDDLADAGWRVVVITSAMSDAEVVRRIARALAQRAA